MEERLEGQLEGHFEGQLGGHLFLSSANKEGGGLIHNPFEVDCLAIRLFPLIFPTTRQPFR